MKKKHANPKDFLHQVYTVENGVKEHNKNQQALGFLKRVIVVSIGLRVLKIFDKIENAEIKALKSKKD